MPSYKDKGLWSLSVLLAAEDPAIAVHVRAMLDAARRTRFHLDLAEGLDRAVETLRRRPYDLLLLDVDLSRAPGQEALLRAQMLAHRIPIVVTTPHRDDDLALRAVEAGVQEVLVHDSWTAEVCERVLRHAVTRHRIVTTVRRSHITSIAQPLFDPQTGLATETAFLRRVQESLDLAHRFKEKPALLLLELDRFRRLSGQLGPLVGARVLEEVGRRLSWCVRRSDLTGRLGEDRFTVLLPNVPGSWAVRAVAERIRLAVAAPFQVDSSQTRLSASVGTACFPHDGETAADLLASAEAAMMEAKGSGGNRCCFFRSLVMPPWPEAEATGSSSLSRALAQGERG